jgi:D-alanine-D-alanine ligase
MICVMQPTKSEIIAVLYGGTSSEREVALRSGEAVATALENSGYQVRLIDTGPISEEDLLDSLKGCSVVFPVLHGAGGEDGSVQHWLDNHGYKYVGTKAVVSELCFDKAGFKQAIEKLGIRTPRGGLVDLEAFKQSPLISQPYVLKPFDGGSSVDTFIVRSPESVDTHSIQAAFEKYHEMLLEELIEGVELTVGVLGDQALPVIEIIPPSDGEFDYENKYNGKSQELCPPQHVDQNIQKQAQEIAVHIHRSLGLRDMSRTDIIIRRSDNVLFTLETNTIPGMTDQSLLPKAAAVAGYSMPELCDTLVRRALQR